MCQGNYKDEIENPALINTKMDYFDCYKQL